MLWRGCIRRNCRRNRPCRPRRRSPPPTANPPTSSSPPRAEKGSRANSEADWDDGASTASASGRSGGGGRQALDDGEEEQNCDLFAAAVEMLREKRAATRVAGLERLQELMTARLQDEECAFRSDTVAALALGCARRGAADEAAAALRVLGLHAVTLGGADACAAIFRDAAPALEALVRTGKAEAVRAEAAETLAMLCFVGAEEPGEALRAMGLLASVAHAAPPRVAEAATRGWSLLLTTVPARRVAGAFVEEHLRRFDALLHADDVELRVAAGEALALLFVTFDLGALPDSSAGGDGEARGAGDGGTADGEGADAAGDGAAGASHTQRLEDITARMQALATNRGDGAAARRSKGDRADLRKAFRELAAVVGGAPPAEQRVGLRHGDAVAVATLAGHCQLNAFRRYLGGGLAVHLQENALCWQVFRYRPISDAPERMTGRQKRLLRSPSTKSMSNLRKSERASKADLFSLG